MAEKEALLALKRTTCNHLVADYRKVAEKIIIFWVFLRPLGVEGG
jgi:hypothetical protein